MYRNFGDMFFEDVTYLAGLGVNTKSVGWGVAFLDFDQDGWKDIVIANGHIYPELTQSRISESYAQPKTVYWNLGNGAFRDVTAEAGAVLTRPQVSRGLATGDLDGDGAPEIVIVNMNASPAVLRQEGIKGNSILVELIGTKSNRSAIGARVTLEVGELRQIDEVRSGGSYASQSDFRLHFGLGKADRVRRLGVRWPDGTEEEFSDIEANSSIQIREGAGIVGKRTVRE